IWVLDQTKKISRTGGGPDPGAKACQSPDRFAGCGRGRSVHVQHPAVRRGAEVPPGLSGDSSTQGANTSVAEDDVHHLVWRGRPSAVTLAVVTQERQWLDLELGSRAGPGVPPRLPGEARIVDPAGVPPRPKCPALGPGTGNRGATRRQASGVLLRKEDGVAQA